MSPQEARRLINEEGRTHTMLAYFTKRNGETRRMLFTYTGASSPKPHLMCVHDLEKGQPRTLNLRTLQSLKVLRSRVRRAEDRNPVPSRKPGEFSEDFLKAQQAIQGLFY